MNKIVLNVGLIVFFICVVFFSRMDLPIQSVLIKSFIVFFIVTAMMSIAAILFMKSVNKALLQKRRETSQTLK